MEEATVKYRQVAEERDASIKKIEDQDKSIADEKQKMQDLQDANRKLENQIKNSKDLIV